MVVPCFLHVRIQKCSRQLGATKRVHIHRQESNIANNINPKVFRIEFYAVEWHPFAVPENDVAAMKIAVTLSNKSKDRSIRKMRLVLLKVACCPSLQFQKRWILTQQRFSEKQLEMLLCLEEILLPMTEWT